MISITLKPYVLEVSQNCKGLFNVSTPDYSFEDVVPSMLMIALFPLLRQKREVSLSTDNDETKALVELLLNNLHGYNHFFNPNQEFINNFIKNLEYFSENTPYDIYSLLKQLEGKDFLMCGAGPSLKSHIDKVESFNGVSFACGSAIRAFSNLKINPTFCVALDPFDTELERLKDLDPEWTKDQTLLFGSSAHPGILDIWKGKVVYLPTVTSTNLWRYFFPNTQLLDVDVGGVSTFTLNLAAKCKAPNIHMIGFDLGPDDKNRLYDSSVNFDLETTTQNQFMMDKEALVLDRIIKKFNLNVYNYASNKKLSNAKYLEELKQPKKEDFKDLSFKNFKLKKALKLLPKFKRAIKEISVDNIKNSILYAPLFKEYDKVFEYVSYRTGHYDTDLLHSILTNIKEGIE